MNPALVILASVFVGVAGLIHVLIFVMESVLFSRETVYRRFGVRSAADAETLKPLMLNQGFYNLFLALGAATGLVLLGIATGAGLAIAAFALLSMTLAAVVLIVSNRTLWRAAVVQGGPALIGFVLLVAALAS